MKIDRNIAYVGTLQELGRPYAMLYVDTATNILYILVRNSEGEGDSFVVAKVTPYEVKAYLDEQEGLTDLVGRGLCGIATLKDGVLNLKDVGTRTFLPTAQMKEMNIFDPELCDDDIWIEIFLSRIINNKPIEIA